MEFNKNISFPTFKSFKVWFDATTKNHPFKTGRNRGCFHDDFAQGKVPIDFLQEYAKQYYIFIQLTNTNVTWTLVNYLDLCEEHGPEGEWLLARLYKLGLVKEEDYEGMRVQVERAAGGPQPGSQYFSWPDVLYDRYRISHPQ